MRELLALDAVSVTQEYRPIRKAQVNTVQELLRGALLFCFLLCSFF